MGQLNKKQIAAIVNEVTDYYLTRRDFNGLPLASLRKKYLLTKAGLKSLIESGNIEARLATVTPIHTSKPCRLVTGMPN